MTPEDRAFIKEAIREAFEARDEELLGMSKIAHTEQHIAVSEFCSAMKVARDAGIKAVIGIVITGVAAIVILGIRSWK